MRLSKRREGKSLSDWQCFKLLRPAHFGDNQRYAPAPIPSKPDADSSLVTSVRYFWWAYGVALPLRGQGRQ